MESAPPTLEYVSRSAALQALLRCVDVEFELLSSIGG